MKIKISLLLAVLFICCEIAYSQIPEAKSRSGIINVKPSKTTSSIVRSTLYDNKNIEDYTEQIIVLEQQLESDPENIDALISLFKIYSMTNNPEKASDYIITLFEIKVSENKSPALEKLNSDKIITELKVLNDDLLRSLVDYKNKSPIYINLAFLNLILDNKNKAISYAKEAVINCQNHSLLRILINRIYKYQLYEDVVNLCNRYLLYIDNKDKIIISLKIINLAKMGNIDAAIKEYEILDFDIGAGPKNILYKALKEKSKSDKEIIKVLFPKLPASEGYYELYKMEENEKMDMIAAKLIKEYPDSPEANLIKASNLIKENKNDEALKLLNSIRSQITSEIEINDYNILLSEISSQPINEAEKLMDSGYPKKALELLENENIQESPELYCLKAKCYIALNEMQMALENLNNAMAMDSENPGVYLAFINYYIETGDTETARNYIEQAKELKSINEDNNVDEIVNYTKIVNKMDAEKYVDKITELYEQQRYEEAWNEIEKALKISDDVSSLHFYKGLVYIAKNNYAASTSEFYKAIELDENSVLSYYYLALAFDNLSERESAYEYYKKFIEVLPQDFYGASEAVDYAKARIEKLK